MEDQYIKSLEVEAKKLGVGVCTLYIDPTLPPTFECPTLFHERLQHTILDVEAIKLALDETRKQGISK